MQSFKITQNRKACSKSRSTSKSKPKSAQFMLENFTFQSPYKDLNHSMVCQPALFKNIDQSNITEYNVFQQQEHDLTASPIEQAHQESHFYSQFHQLQTLDDQSTQSDNLWLRDPNILSQKLSSLQDRVQVLESYRLICEKRIKELAPSHPLPITQQHCGMPNPDAEEIKNRLRSQHDENSQQEIHRLRSLIDQLHQEKDQLSQQLRSANNNQNSEDHDLLQQNQALNQEVLRLQNMLQKEQARSEQYKTEKEELIQYFDDNVKHISHEVDSESDKRIHDDLTQQVKTLEEEILLFKEKTRSQKRETDLYHSQISEFSLKIKDQQEQIDHQRQLIQDKTSLIEQLRNSVRQLEESVFITTKEKERVVEEMQLMEKRNKLEEESLKKRLTLHEDFAKHQEEKRIEVEDKYQCEIDDIKSIYDDKIHLLQKTQSELKDKVNDFETQVKELKRVRERLMNENDENSSRITILEEDILTKSKQVELLEQSVMELKEINARLEAQLDESVQKYHDEIFHKERMEMEMKRAMEQQEYTKKLLETQIETNENLSKRCKIVEDELDYLKKESSTQINELSERVQEQEEVIDQLNSQIEIHKSSIENLMNVKEEQEGLIKEQKREIQNMTSIKSQMEQSIHDMNQKIEILEENEKKMFEISQQNEELSEQVRALEVELQEYNDKVDYFNGELENSHNTIALLQKNLRENAVTIEQTQQERNQLQHQLSQIENRLSHTHDQNEDLESKVSSMHKQVNEVAIENERLKRNLLQTEHEKNDLSIEVQNLKGSVQEKEINLDELGQQIKDLEEELNSYHNNTKQFLGGLLRSLDLLPSLSQIRDQFLQILRQYDNQTNIYPPLSQLIETITQQIQGEISQSETLNDIVTKLEAQLSNQMGIEQAQSEKIESLVMQNQQMEDEMKSMKYHSEGKDNEVSRLRGQVDNLREDNNILVGKVNAMEEEVKASKVLAQLSQKDQQALKMKEQMMSQVVKEKSQVEEFFKRTMMMLAEGEIKRKMTEVFKLMNDRFKLENSRLTNESSIDQLEKDLTDIITNMRSDEDGAMVKAQRLRKEIFEVEEKLNQCDEQIELIAKREMEINDELSTLIKSHLFKNLSYESKVEPITILTKESTELKNQVSMKNKMINELQREINQYRVKSECHSFNTSTNDERLLFNKTHKTTFDHGLGHLTQSQLNEINPMRSCANVHHHDTSFKVLNLQPIKVDNEYMNKNQVFQENNMIPNSIRSNFTVDKEAFYSKTPSQQFSIARDHKPMDKNDFMSPTSNTTFDYYNGDEVQHKENYKKPQLHSQSSQDTITSNQMAQAKEFNAYHSETVKRPMPKGLTPLKPRISQLRNNVEQSRSNKTSRQNE